MRAKGQEPDPHKIRCMKGNPSNITFNQTTEAICAIIRKLIIPTEQGKKATKTLLNLRNEPIKKNGKLATA